MKDKHGIGQAIVMITQLSINMLVPVFMCLFIGIWLDKQLGTGWLTLVFLILGIMASIRSMFITLKPLLKGEREKKDEASKSLKFDSGSPFPQKVFEYLSPHPK